MEIGDHTAVILAKARQERGAAKVKRRRDDKSAATSAKTEYHLSLGNRDFGRKSITEITAPLILTKLRKVEVFGANASTIKAEASRSSKLGWRFGPKEVREPYLDGFRSPVLI